MKRRNFLKGVLGGIIGITSSFSILKAATQNVDKPIQEEHNVFMGLLYNGKEITEKDYRRIKSTKEWKLQTDGTIINIEGMQFPQTKNDWGDVNEFAFYTAEKGGHRLISGKLTRQVFIAFGDTISFPPQYIKVGL